MELVSCPRASTRGGPAGGTNRLTIRGSPECPAILLISPISGAQAPPGRVVLGPGTTRPGSWTSSALPGTTWIPGSEQGSRIAGHRCLLLDHDRGCLLLRSGVPVRVDHLALDPGGRAAARPRPEVPGDEPVGAQRASRD